MEPGRRFNHVALTDKADHRFILLSHNGAGPNVPIIPFEDVVVGRSTWRMANGAEDLRVSRQTLRLRDVGLGFLEAVSLRTMDPPARFHQRFGQFTDLRPGAAPVRLRDGDIVELVPRGLAFEVKDVLPWEMRKAEAPPDGAPLVNFPRVNTMPIPEDFAADADARAQNASPPLPPPPAPVASPSAQVSALETQPTILVSPTVVSLSSSSSSSSSSGWIRTRDKQRSASADCLPAAPLEQTADSAPKRIKTEPRAAAAECLSDGNGGDDERELVQPHRCIEGAQLLLGYIVSAVSRPDGAGDGRPACLSGQSELRADGVLECAAGTFDEAVSWRASEARRRQLACSFTFDAMQSTFEGRTLAVALGFHRCGDAGESVDAPRQALARLLGDEYPVCDSLASCDSAKLQRDADEQRVLFEANDSEKMLMEAFRRLASVHLVAAPQPALVRTALKPHQLQGLGWMLQREMAPHPLPPFWTKCDRFGPVAWKPASAHLWGTQHAHVAFTFLVVVHRFNATRASRYEHFPRQIAFRIINMCPIETFYVHELTQIKTSRHPVTARGGILADDMGVGKTLQIISLIACNSAVKLVPLRSATDVFDSSIYTRLLDSSDEADGAPVAATAAVDDADPVSLNLSPACNGGKPRRPTLIVCPLSVMSNWEQQIEAHVGTNVMSVLVYYGAKRAGVTKEQLERHDVVITTYGAVTVECRDPDDRKKPKTVPVKSRALGALLRGDGISNDENDGNDDGDDDNVGGDGGDGAPDRPADRGAGPNKRSAPTAARFVVDEAHSPAGGVLRQVKWRRVILDEAHYIRNASTQVSKAVRRLDAWFRWCLTGTPVQNRVQDVQPLFAFLHEEVFSDSRMFLRHITKPITSNRAEGFVRLRTLMLSACLRRTKDSLDEHGQPIVSLPPKTLHMTRLTLVAKEAAQYLALDAKCASLFERLEALGRAVINKVYSFLLLLILRLRQTCDHTMLCGDLEGILENAERTLEIGDAFDGDALADRFENAELTENGCSECGSRAGTMWVTSTCFHCLCDSHRDELRVSGVCPVCHDAVDPDTELHRGPPCKARRERMRLAVGALPSTKMREVLRVVKDVKARGGPRAKTVVFSQWTSFLDLVEDFLVASGFRCARIDGSMNAQERVLAMQAFNSENAGSPVVMLASLMAAGVGINLLGACNVCLCDPWWNPATEDQAIDRVHRMGQTQPVNVYRLLVANTIEERLLRLHESKRQIAGVALVLRSPEELQEMKLAQMRFLFGVRPSFARLAE